MRKGSGEGLDLDLASDRQGLDRAVAPVPPAPSPAGQYGETEDDGSDCGSSYECQERYGHGREGRGREEARMAASPSPFSFVCGCVLPWVRGLLAFVRLTPQNIGLGTFFP